MTSRLDNLIAHRLRVPLIKPYRLSLGSIEHYDTIVVCATDTEGRQGFGEATVVTGYTDETIDDAWKTARAFCERVIREPHDGAMAAARALGATHPFTASAFGTALEMLALSGTWHAPKRAAPILALLDGKDDETLEREFESLFAGGYRTVKIKVGFDPAKDLAFVRSVQRTVRGRALIRIDANQGYSAEEGVAFVRGLDPAGIELFEQPCAAGDWDAHLAVARVAQVPLMLDESIYGIADIEKAARLQCAQYIKLKLMKLVTMADLAAGLARIRELGMKTVLGNGVASDAGCWLEAVVAAQHIDNAGEMNGFLKVRATLLDPPLGFANGAIQLGAEVPRFDLDAVQRFSVDSIRVAPSRAHA